MEQINLFGIQSSHTKDPISSHIAETAHNTSGDRKKNLQKVYNILCLYQKPMTAREIYFKNKDYFDISGLDKIEVSRRLSDMVRPEIASVRQCGVRLCSVTKTKNGNPATLGTYEVIR